MSEEPLISKLEDKETEAAESPIKTVVTPVDLIEN